DEQPEQRRAQHVGENDDVAGDRRARPVAAERVKGRCFHHCSPFIRTGSVYPQVGYWQRRLPPPVCSGVEQSCSETLRSGSSGETARDRLASLVVISVAGCARKCAPVVRNGSSTNPRL